MIELLESAVLNHPHLAGAMSVAYACKLILPKLTDLAWQIVKITPSQADDKALSKILSSEPYKWFARGIDWLAGIKARP